MQKCLTSARFLPHSQRVGRLDELADLNESNSRKTASNDGIGFTATSAGRGAKRERNKKRFSEVEDKNLLDVCLSHLANCEFHNLCTPPHFDIQGYEHFGNDWEKIITWGKLDRSVDQVKRRYARIKSKQPEKRSEDESATTFTTTTSASINNIPSSSSTSSVPSITRSDGDEPPRKMQKTSHSSPTFEVRDAAQEIFFLEGDAMIAAQSSQRIFFSRRLA